MKASHRWVNRALAVAALALALPAASHARTLGVEVWTDRGDDAVYQAGDAMQVKVRSSDDAYLLVYEIDSDGQVSVLYPWRRGSNMAEGHRTYRLPPEGSNYELAVEKATGQGYIVAIASRTPFRDMPWYLRTFDPQGENIGYEDRHDDEDGFDENGRVVGDPMVAMERIRRRVLDRPADTDNFASSYASYYVGHEVRYPRYVCNDCHRRDRWAWWDGFDPYYARCSVVDFRVNWNWCWGPCIWTGYVPYYYYVVRPDCPPRYRDGYNDHARWSSWDGYQKWNQMWGNDLVRYKSNPPQGYTPPPSGKPTWNPGGQSPPGFLPPSGPVARRGVFREPIPVRPARSGDDNGSRGTGIWRNPGAASPPREDGGSKPTWTAPPQRPESRPQPDAQPPREEKPDVRPATPPERKPEARPQPRYEPPRQDPPRHETPRQNPPRRDPPPEKKQPADREPARKPIRDR